MLPFSAAWNFNGHTIWRSASEVVGGLVHSRSRPLSTGGILSRCALRRRGLVLAVAALMSDPIRSENRVKAKKMAVTEVEPRSSSNFEEERRTKKRCKDRICLPFWKCKYYRRLLARIKKNNSQNATKNGIEEDAELKEREKNTPKMRLHTQFSKSTSANHYSTKEREARRGHPR